MCCCCSSASWSSVQVDAAELRDKLERVSRAASLFFAAALAACMSLDNSINVPPMRRYTEKLIATAGAKLTIDRCDMFDGSRKGFCVVRGTPAELAKFSAQLGLAKKSPERAYGELTCLAINAFGQSDDHAHVAKSGITEFRARAPLPANQDNVHFVSFYAGEGEACLELEYPYG